MIAITGTMRKPVEQAVVSLRAAAAAFKRIWGAVRPALTPKAIWGSFISRPYPVTGRSKC